GPVRAALGLEDLDVVVVEREEQLFDLARLGVRDRPNDVLLRDVTLLAPAGEQTLSLLLVLRVDPGTLGSGLLGLFFLRCCFHRSSSRCSSLVWSTVLRSGRFMSW